MFACLGEDTRRLREARGRSFPWYVLEGLLFDNGYQAVLLYRLASWFRRHRIPALGPFVARLNLFLTGVDISPAAEIGPGLLISHGVGLVVGGATRIGARAHLLHGATLGGPATSRRDEMPTLGDDVFVATGATVIGGVHVGNGAFLGAHVLVTRDVPDHTRVIHEPALRLSPRSGAAAAAAGAAPQRDPVG